MIRRRRNPGYPPLSGIAGNDTDALQTDVMRFLSILGLCLMAVFALVRSIPVQETPHPPSKPETKLLQQEIRLQQERAQALQEELQRLQEAVATATARHAGAVQAATAAEEHLARVLDQTREARERRERITGELQDLERRLRQNRRELDGLQQAVEDRTHSLQRRAQQLRQTQRALNGVEQQLQALREQPSPEPAPVPDEPAAEEAPSARQVETQGFTLRFASVQALDRLVATGTVRLYGMRDRQAWQLSLAGGRPAFAPAAFPKWFHKMAPATVPAEYVHSLQQASTTPSGSATVWGVQIPAATQQDINALTHAHTGGTLVIRADGQVALEGE